MVLPRAVRRMLSSGPRLRHVPRPGMDKVWGKYKPYAEGEITHTLSPNEQKIIAPLFRNVADKLRHKVTDNAPYVLPPVLLFYGVFKGANWLFEREQHKEWA